MALTNWSMSAVGYPPSTRSGTAVVGLTHMSTFAAMRIAEELGMRSGWLMADGATPQLEHVRRNAPTQISLRDFIADRRVAHTEGVSTGTLLFAAGSAGLRPVEGQSLIAWAEAQQQPWIEIVDNEVAYWGGLDAAGQGRLLAWFCCQRPLDGDWRALRLDPKAGSRLRAGLFEHGWTRNLELVNTGRRTCDLWGGVHAACLLEHVGRPLPGQVQVGVRVRTSLGELIADELDEACPLADDTGRLKPNRSGLWKT